MGDHKLDASLVETIVGQVKSQGLFDKFRKECLADVDTKPAYLNLRQLVENTVNKFLSKQEWTPELNKNQLREKMRRNIIEMNFLEAGVERLVEQVMLPKISTVFQPNIEEMVYKHLGIEQPRVEKLEPPGLSELSLETAPVCPPASAPPPPLPPPPPAEQPVPPPPDSSKNLEADLLPTDLETVSSPDSNRSNSEDKSSKQQDLDESREQLKEESSAFDQEDNHHHGEEEEEIKMEVDDEESPPFEPIEAEVQHPPTAPPPEVCTLKTESQESNISGLTSQDSIESERSQVIGHITNVDNNLVPPPPAQSALKEVVKAEPVDTSPLPLKDESQLSQVSSDTQNSIKFDQKTSTTEEPLKMDISEEAQMPSRFPVPDRNANNEVVTSFDLHKEAITFEQVKRESDDDPADGGDVEKMSVDTSSQASTTTPPVPPAEVPPPLPPPETDTETIDAKPQAMLEPANLCPSGEILVNKILVRANLTEDTEDSLLDDSGDSMDLKIVESDSRGSGVSASNQSAVDTRESKKDHRSSSSSSTQHKSSSHKSSRDRDRGRDKERSRHRSRDRHHKSSDHHRSKSGRGESDRKREKERDGKRSNGDSSCKEGRGGVERRSRDRDSNDGANSSGPKATKEKATGSESQQKATSSPKSREDNNKTSGGGGGGKEAEQAKAAENVLDGTEMTDRLQQPIVVDQFLDGQELNLQMRAPTPPTRDPSKQPKKPKIAANFKEAMRLSKVRKMMDLERSKEEERAAVELNKAQEEMQNSVSSSSENEGGDESLHYFPEESGVVKFPESASEKWWNRVKAQDEEKELVSMVKMFLDAGVKRTAANKEDDPTVPEKKRSKLDGKKETTTTTITKRLNGLAQTTTVAEATASEMLIGDPDMDYHEAEVVLDDLLVPPQLVTENNNVQAENKNYGLAFNKLGEWDSGTKLMVSKFIPFELQSTEMQNWS